MPEPQTIANVLTASGGLDPARELTELHLADGRIIRLDTRMLTTDALDRPATRAAAAIELSETTVIPLVEERLTLDKHTVETGTVRLRKTIQEYSEALDEPLDIHTYDIERIILNRPIEALPSTRQEGETTIYPLVEEQLVLTKQLILKEEVRVTRRRSERRDTQVVTLRREHLTVERELVSPPSKS